MHIIKPARQWGRMLDSHCGSSPLSRSDAGQGLRSSGPIPTVVHARDAGNIPGTIIKHLPFGTSGGQRSLNYFFKWGDSIYHGGEVFFLEATKRRVLFYNTIC